MEHLKNLPVAEMPALNEKSVWTAPVVQILDMDEAQGATSGGAADRFGSLSTP